MMNVVITWVMVITLYNPAADKTGQYKYYPIATLAECQAKVKAHLATHANNSIPNRYVVGNCVIYSVNVVHAGW